MLAYDSAYDIRLAVEEDAWERPAAIVQPAGPVIVANTSRRIGTMVRPFAIYIYPPKQDTAKAAELEAERVEGVVFNMFRVGGYGGYPARLPSYDWTGVEDNEALIDADAIAYLFVSDSNIDHRPDPDDETLQTVIAEVRLNWRTPGQASGTGPIVEKVNTTGTIAGS
jgi:hypothetical protein